MRTVVLVKPDYISHSRSTAEQQICRTQYFSVLLSKDTDPSRAVILLHLLKLQPLKKPRISAVDIYAEISLPSCTSTLWTKISTFLCSVQNLFVGGIRSHRHAQQAIEAAKDQKHQPSMNKKMSLGSIVPVCPPLHSPHSCLSRFS